MKKLILLLFVFVAIIFSNQKKLVFADEKTDVYIVYEQKQYQKGEIINISVEIKAFANLFETILRYNYDETLLEVVAQDEGYFYLNNHSIFSKFIVNKKFNQNVLYAEMLKETLDEGFYSSYKNNLCKISFKAIKSIDDITNCFANFQIYLFDNHHQIINHQIKYQEKMKTKWNIQEMILEVGSTMPNIKELLIVMNRNEDEYLIFLEEELDLTIVSEQILQIGLYDLITGYYQTYTKIIKIKDLTKPIVSGDSEIIIDDVALTEYDFKTKINVNDNYDLSPQIFVCYFDDEHEITYSEAINKIISTRMLRVGYYAVDSSSNQSDYFYVNYFLNDTTKPEIIGNEIINIKDVELESFDIMSCFQVTDNLDLNPKIVITIYDMLGNPVNQLSDGLNYDTPCQVVVFGIDQDGNQSSDFTATINLIDTISPVITGQSITTINDYQIDDLDFTTLVEVTDQDPRPIIIVCKFNEEENLNIEDFKSYLKTGHSGVIEYQTFDYSNNMSYFKMQINVVDTTKPHISVNIEDGGLYKTLDAIEWNVTDNFNQELTVNVYIDNRPYDASLLTDGKHCLFIEAIDAAGNVSNLNYNFVISNATFVENVVNGNIKLKTSTYLIIISSMMLIIIIVKIIINRFKKRKI